jgi:hypothetical protein
MTGPRLFPDYAAVPTRLERARARAENQRGQGSLFDGGDRDDEPAAACPVCDGEHTEAECRHGTAPAMF